MIDAKRCILINLSCDLLFRSGKYIFESSKSVLLHSNNVTKTQCSQYIHSQYIPDCERVMRMSKLLGFFVSTLKKRKIYFYPTASHTVSN